MCEPSNEIKLCTCDKESAKTNENYWVLTESKDRGVFLIGETVMYPNHHLLFDEDSIEKMAHILNSKNRFDSEIEHFKEDILSLYFKAEYNTNYVDKIIAIHFQYENGGWVHIDSIPIGHEDHLQISSGYIHEPFENKD